MRFLFGSFWFLPSSLPPSLPLFFFPSFPTFSFIPTSLLLLHSHHLSFYPLFSFFLPLLFLSFSWYPDRERPLSYVNRLYILAHVFWDNLVFKVLIRIHSNVLILSLRDSLITNQGTDFDTKSQP